MYRCKSRTRKKAKCQRTDAYELWCWEDFESPLDCKEIKPGNPKGNQSWIFIGRTDAEAEAPILWPPDAKSQLIGRDPDAEKNWGQKEKRVTEDEMVECHHWLNGHKFEQTPGDGEGQRGLACCSPWGHKESDTTEQLNNNNPSDFGMISRLCSLSLPRRTSVCLDSSFLHSSQKIIYSHKTGILTVLAWWFLSLLRPSDLHCLLFKVWARLPHFEDSGVHPMVVYRARWVGHQVLHHNQKQRILLIFVSKLNPSSNQPFETLYLLCMVVLMLLTKYVRICTKTEQYARDEGWNSSQFLSSFTDKHIINAELRCIALLVLVKIY